MDESDPSADLPASASDDGPPDVTRGSDGPADALTLEEDDFLPERSLRAPGPGLPESLLWIVGFFAVQVAASVAIMAAVLGYNAFTLGAEDTARMLQDPEGLQELVKQSTVVLFVGIQFAIIVSSVFAGYLRLGKNRKRYLPLQPIPLRHCVVLGLLICPLVIFCGQLLAVFLKGWERIVEVVKNAPELEWLKVFLEGLDQQDSMKVIQDLAEQASLPVLLLVIAVVPAVAEELIFRGLIGRGLVARWGMLWGILITSALFAMVHVHPAQVLALIPLAVCMHVAYLATRSFWAPMAIHFINNAWAVVAMKYLVEHPDLLEQTEKMEHSWWLLAASGCCVLALISLSWKMRVQYVDADGTLWDPGYVAAETPPPEAALTRCFVSTQPIHFLAALSSLGLFAIVLAYTIYEAVKQAA